MTKPHYQDESVTLYHGDCLDILAQLPDASVDSVVTDPPYGLEFMGKDWDAPWAKNAGIGGHSAGFSTKVYKDGSTARIPNYTGNTNPTCRNCGGLRSGNPGKKGQQPCRCDAPKFDNTQLPRMRAFGAWCEIWAAECLRVLKPGGHLLAFGGTRTWHRLAVAVEDAGFEIRDNIAWIYGSGFPKSLNVATAVDKHRADDNRADLLPDEARFCEWMREHSGLTELDAKRTLGSARFVTGIVEIVNTATVDAPRMGRRAMVPTSAAWEKVRPMLATHPPEWIEQLVKAPPKEQTLADWNAGKGNGTVGDNEWAGWGTALKPAFEPVVVARKPLSGTVAANVLAYGTGALNIDGCRVEHDGTTDLGRWPSNVLLDPDAAAQLDKQSGQLKSGKMLPTHTVAGRAVYGQNAAGGYVTSETYGDEGGASRFFPVFRYNAKAPTAERPTANGVAHPTVKPLDLMRWLVRLVTPPGGLVLEPFAGSGTTAEACIHEHMRCIAIERETDYLPLIVNRLTKPIEIGFDFTTGIE